MSKWKAAKEGCEYCEIDGISTPVVEVDDGSTTCPDCGSLVVQG